MSLADYQQTLVEDIDETPFQNQIIKLMVTYGWWYYFTKMSKGSPKGFFDLFAIRHKNDECRIILAENKREKNYRHTEEQKKLMALCGGDGGRAIGDLINAGGGSMKFRLETYLWQPSDMDKIIQTLR